MVRLWIAVAVALGLAATATAGARAADPPDPGSTQAFQWRAGANVYPYLVYVPTTYDRARPAPLVVMTHGCQTTAEQQMRANLYNRVAEREHFVVLYPDVDALEAQQPGPTQRCWQFPLPTSWHRGSGDAAAIAGMTRAVMARRRIDPERVYMVGMSAGSFMTSIMAAAYPDLYAAVAINAGGAYADPGCLLGNPVNTPAAVSAQLAYAEMGPRARVVPRLVMGGDKDQGVPPACADKALEQGLRTNNLVISGHQDGPIPLKPSAVREEPNPGGYSSTVSTYRDPDGCTVGQRWSIHGMNHFWPGGSSDPKLANFTDPKGPTGAEVSWRFLARYSKTSTGVRCAQEAVGCLNARGGIKGTRLGASRLGRTRARQRKAIRGKLRSRRGGIDRYCVRGGGAMRIGYPTGRLRRGRLRRLVRKRGSRALLSLTSSRRFRLKGLRVGSHTKTLRRKLRHERRFRVGHNHWYLIAGRHSRLLFQVRGGRVRQIGIASTSLTTTRPRARTFLRGWHLGS